MVERSLDEVTLRLFLRRGPRRDDNGCAALQKAIGDGLSGALRASGH
jgi:hypothetical protein